MDQNSSATTPLPMALITGASSGIGAAIAEQLAMRGHRLLLVARREDRLEALAHRLHATYGVEVHTLGIDLAGDGAPQRVLEFTRARALEVEILVNNAGVGVYGEFCRSDVQAQLSMVRLNCLSMLHLTHLFIAGMVERRRGRVLIVASTTLVPAPYITTYAATKGFDLLFAEGLAEEVARHGVTVSALCPGPTHTEIFSDSAVESDHRRLQSAEAVAAKAVAGLFAGRRYIRPSWMAQIVANAPRFFPRATVSGAMDAYYRPRPG